MPHTGVVGVPSTRLPSGRRSRALNGNHGGAFGRPRSHAPALADNGRVRAAHAKERPSIGQGAEKWVRGGHNAAPLRRQSHDDKASPLCGRHEPTVSRHDENGPAEDAICARKCVPRGTPQAPLRAERLPECKPLAQACAASGPQAAAAYDAAGTRPTTLDEEALSATPTNGHANSSTMRRTP